MYPPEPPRSTFRLVLPEYGLITAVLGYLFCYLVVGAATPVIAHELSVIVDGFDPSLVGVGAAVLLWTILILTLIEQARVQLRENPRHFTTRETARIFLSDQVNPSLTSRTAAGVLVAGILVWSGYAPFIDHAETLLETFVWVMEARQPPPLSAEAVLYVALYGILYSIFAWLADRVIVGGIRQAVANRYRD
ncbi:MAG: hypothetical protein ABEJ27_04535 [Halodesulfurarchaeum sp.]